MPIPVRTADADYHYHVYDYIGSQPFTLSNAQPQRNNMRFYSMVQDLAGLFQIGQANHVPNIALTNLGAAITDDAANRNIMALSFGTLAMNPDEIVITGGIHAREWVAPEMAYLLAEYLIKNYPDPNLPIHALDPYERAIRLTVDNRRIHVIPMLNPAGNAYTVFTAGQDARLWRRNRRPMPATAAGWLNALTDPATGLTRAPFQNAQTVLGITSYSVPRYLAAATLNPTDLPNNATTGVDLNRNYQTVAYGHNCAPAYENSEPGEDAYFGTGAASEIETQNVQAFLFGKNIETSIDYHSYSKYILYPSELGNPGPVGANFTRLGEILQRLIAPSWSFSFGYDYKLGTPRALVGYDATGTLADYTGQQHNSRSFVIELDPAPGLLSWEFELPEDQIRTVFEKNIRAALALMVAAGNQSTFATTTSCCCFKRRTISSNERHFLGWNVYGRGNRLPA